MDFKKEEGRIFLENEEGKTIAEVVFPTGPDGVALITHTRVDPSLQGQGVAGKLLDAVVEELRAKGQKTRATCWYAVEWFGYNPDKKDVYIEDPEYNPSCNL